MNIRWSAAAQRFEAEFQEFQGDLFCVKECGFKTDGAPGWIWWTQKIPVINKLRANKPVSGLTITPEALGVYTSLNAQEEKNAEVRKQLTAVRKEQKKAGITRDPDTIPTLPPGAAWISAEHLPPWQSLIQHRPDTKPPENLPECVICGQKVYAYELQNPPQCLWCEGHPESNFI